MVYDVTLEKITTDLNSLKNYKAHESEDHIPSELNRLKKYTN